MSTAALDKHILIIDDETDLGEALQEILSLDFDKVDFVNDSTQALKRIEEGSYTLILSDYKMPGLSGLELASLVRSKGLLTTLVWISGYVDKQMALNALRLGVLDIIEKPVDPEELSRFIFRAYDIERRRYEIIRANQDSLTSRKMLGLLYASDSRIQKSRASNNDVS